MADYCGAGSKEVDAIAIVAFSDVVSVTKNQMFLKT